MWSAWRTGASQWGVRQVWSRSRRNSFWLPVNNSRSGVHGGDAAGVGVGVETAQQRRALPGQVLHHAPGDFSGDGVAADEERGLIRVVPGAE
jgi:hypothetical protein